MTVRFFFLRAREREEYGLESHNVLLTMPCSTSSDLHAVKASVPARGRKRLCDCAVRHGRSSLLLFFSVPTTCDVLDHSTVHHCNMFQEFGAHAKAHVPHEQISMHTFGQIMTRVQWNMPIISQELQFSTSSPPCNVVCWRQTGTVHISCIRHKFIHLKNSSRSTGPQSNNTMEQSWSDKYHASQPTAPR